MTRAKGKGKAVRRTAWCGLWMGDLLIRGMAGNKRACQLFTQRRYEYLTFNNIEYVRVEIRVVPITRKRRAKS